MSDADQGSAASGEAAWIRHKAGMTGSGWGQRVKAKEAPANSSSEPEWLVKRKGPVPPDRPFVT